MTRRATITRAKKAGAPMIYAAYGLGKVETPDITINSIAELLDIL